MLHSSHLYSLFVRENSSISKVRQQVLEYYINQVNFAEKEQQVREIIEEIIL